MCDDSAVLVKHYEYGEDLEIPCTKAMIQRHDDAVIPNHWAELQRIKNEIFGEEFWAVEYYPPHDETVDNANIYWLYVFDSCLAAIPSVGSR